MTFRPGEVRIIVSVNHRRLWVVAGDDTLRSTTVSVASGQELHYAGRRWRFATPRGRLRVLGKRTDPVWSPPDWHYAEVAQQHGLGLRTLPTAGVRLRDGSRIVVRDSIAGVIMPGDTTFLALPVDEHIVFDSTLFIPPVGTHNRRLVGELGKYALDLGNGYLLHGTPDQRSIGTATTHGCIRLSDADLEWLYRHIPVGTEVQVR
jgi:lipoprotein-anchoring transpeptidase ErfK/SrfK